MSFSDVTKHTLIALGSGCVFSLGFEPFGIWPLTIFSVAGLFYVVTMATSSREIFQYCIAYGIGKFGVGVSWIYVSIHEFGNASIPLTLLLVAVFVLGLSLFIWVVGYFTRKEIGLLVREGSTLGALFKCWIFTTIWVTYEYGMEILLSGFPWLLSGYALLDIPFNGLAPILGVHGLSFVLVLVATSIRYAVQYKPVLWQLLVLIPAWGFHDVDWTEETGEISVALVQANVALTEKWDPLHYQSLLSNSLDLTRSVGEKDLVVWNEGALPATVDTVSASLTAYLDNPRAVPLMIGLLDFENESNAHEDTTIAYNVLALFDHDEVSVYRKRKLVPFGEFVPFEKWIRGTIEFFDLPLSSFSEGKFSQRGMDIGDLSIATFICYEVAYPHFVARDVSRLEAEMLVVASEDSWFGRSIGPHQHLQIARMRALENGKYLLRATNSGITAVVAPDGSVVNRLPQFEQGVLEANIFAMSGLTPYSRMNKGTSLLVLLFFLALRGLMIYLNRRIGALDSN